MFLTLTLLGAFHLACVALMIVGLFRAVPETEEDALAANFHQQNSLPSNRALRHDASPQAVSALRAA